MGQIGPASSRLNQPPATIMDRPYQISIQDPGRTIQLEQVPVVPIGNKGNHLWGPRNMRIMGTTRSQRMATWTFKGPLSVQPILRTRNKRVQSISRCRLVSPALHRPIFHTWITRERIVQWAARQFNNNGTEDMHLTGPARPGHSHGSVHYRQSTPSVRTKGGTKGDGQSPTHQSPANSKGDRYSKDAECK